jgi:hypothetical protein
MTETAQKRDRREARPIGALIGSVIDPICAKRGFASADLIGAWDEIVGPRYARVTQPEKIAWPRRESASSRGATLVVRVDAGMAIYLQHETSLILEKVNAFLGFAAISKLTIIQGPVEQAARAPQRAAEAPISARSAAHIKECVETIDSDPLREALETLGRRVYGAVERL